MNSLAEELLQAEGLWTDSLRSKSWDEFAESGAPGMHIVITVCDQAAHWGIPDPAAEESEEGRRTAFRTAFARLSRGIRKMLDLPLEDMDTDSVATALGAIQDEALRVSR